MSVRLPSTIKRELVEAAEKIADKVQAQRNQASQLRNLLQIAQTESDVKVLANFIHYQAGRNNKSLREFWEPIQLDVIRELKAIEKRPELQDEELRRIAIQHFFGYIVRHYFFVTRPAAQNAANTPAGR